MQLEVDKISAALRGKNINIAAPKQLSKQVGLAIELNDEGELWFQNHYGTIGFAKADTDTISAFCLCAVGVVSAQLDEEASRTLVESIYQTEIEPVIMAAGLVEDSESAHHNRWHSDERVLERDYRCTELTPATLVDLIAKLADLDTNPTIHVEEHNEQD